MVDAAIAHEFKKARAWQMKIANSGGGCLTTFPSGRTELSFGSAPFGEHALSAFMAAKRAVHFRQELSESVKADKRRKAKRA